jgi:hypothetical protein
MLAPFADGVQTGSIVGIGGVDAPRSQLTRNNASNTTSPFFNFERPIRTEMPLERVVIITALVPLKLVYNFSGKNKTTGVPNLMPNSNYK